MAEIRVEQEKRGLGWLWALLVLLVLALAAWWFFSQSGNAKAGPADTLAPVGALFGAPASEPLVAGIGTFYADHGGPNGTT